MGFSPKSALYQVCLVTILSRSLLSPTGWKHLEIPTCPGLADLRVICLFQSLPNGKVRSSCRTQSNWTFDAFCYVFESCSILPFRQPASHLMIACTWHRRPLASRVELKSDQAHGMKESAETHGYVLDRHLRLKKDAMVLKKVQMETLLERMSSFDTGTSVQKRRKRDPTIVRHV